MTTTITLASGSHPAPAPDCANPQRCLFEAYNWLDRREHTDACPRGVSPVLHAYGMRLNDALPDDRRQELRRYLPNGTSPLAGTAKDGKDTTRGYIALDWLIRISTPAWLDLAGLTADAAALRDLRRVDGSAAVKAAGPVVRDARGHAAAAAADADAAYTDAYAAAAAYTDAAYAAAAAAADTAYTAYTAADAAAYTAYAAAAAAAAADADAYAAAAAAAAAAADAIAADAYAYAAAAADAIAELQASAIRLYDVLVRGEWPGEQ